MPRRHWPLKTLGSGSRNGHHTTGQSSAERWIRGHLVQKGYRALHSTTSLNEYSVRVLTPLLVALAFSPVVARAQCTPGKNSNEAKLLAFFATPISFSPAGSVGALPPGAIRLTFEATYVPSPSREITRTRECFLPKEENTELSPVLPRPRIAIGLPYGFVVEGSYIPPVKIDGAKANLGSVALARPFHLATLGGGRQVDLVVRGHATFGTVEGPITCPREALQNSDAAKACFGTAPSNDSYKPNIAGLEGIVALGGSGSLSGYLGGGYTSLRPRFQVGFRQADGVFDGTEVEVDLTRAALFGGGAWHFAQRAAVTAEVYSVPKDATTFRLGLSARVR